MSSTEFDPYIIVRNTDGQQQDNDDIEQGNLNAGATLTAASDGIVTVRATSAASGETGAYTLAFVSADTNAAASNNTPAPAPSRGKPPAGGGSNNDGIRELETFRGTLQRGDRTLSSGEFVDVHTFQARRGQILAILMESTDFDPYLIVQNTDGQQEDNDDIAEGDLRAMVPITAASDGVVRIQATSASPGESGSYTIRVLLP
jgi:hypothetical protein